MKIRTNLKENPGQSNPHGRDTTSPVSLSTFRPLTCGEVKKINMSSPSKLYENDTIPTTLLKEILPSILDLIVNIVNTLLTQGIFPDGLKEVLVKPLLKKINLELLKSNYKPVSNLTFISKMIEHCAVYLMTKYIEENHLLEPNQSTYHANHSTETVILKVKAEILHAVDKQEVSCLVLLDLSAAFNTIDLHILLECLEKLLWHNWLGIKPDKVISHRENSKGGYRGQEYGWSMVWSSWPRFWGTPRSGPGTCDFYDVYQPLGSICRSNSVEFQLFADDQQLYLSLVMSNQALR